MDHQRCEPSCNVPSCDTFKNHASIVRPSIQIIIVLMHLRDMQCVSLLIIVVGAIDHISNIPQPMISFEMYMMISSRFVLTLILVDRP